MHFSISVLKKKQFRFNNCPSSMSSQTKLIGPQQTSAGTAEPHRSFAATRRSKRGTSLGAKRQKRTSYKEGESNPRPQLC